MKKLLLFLAFSLVCFCQINVHNDYNQTGLNSNETILTPSNVSSQPLQNSCSSSVDDNVFAQPLYVPSVTIGGNTYNLIISVTMNDSIYAFNAANCNLIWSNLAFDTSYSGFPTKSGQNVLYGNLGCLSTPAVDPVNLKVYVVCDSATGPQWYARSFNLTTGALITKSSALTGQVVGTGDTGLAGDNPTGPSDLTSGSNVVFYPQYEFQRAGLILSMDKTLLYVGFGGLDDNRPYHGWIMALNTSTLAVVDIWCSSPNSWGGGIWQAGGAPSIDASGNLYFSVGNGNKSVDSTANVDGIVKLDKNLNFINVWFPSDETNDDTVDADVASNRFLLIPGTNYGVIVSKDYYVYLINISTMTTAQTPFQTCNSCMPTYNSGAYGAAFGNNVLYIPNTNGSIYAFTWNPLSSTFTTTPLWSQTSNSYGSPGAAQISISCNGTSNCILWIITDNSSAFINKVMGTIHALNPATGSEYWNSGEDMGNLSKFAQPVIANGSIYVATQSNEIQMFSLPIPVQLTGEVGLEGLVSFN